MANLTLFKMTSPTRKRQNGTGKSQTRDEADSVVFGAGCFHFVPRVIESHEFSPEEYKRAIAKSLEEIESINNLKIEVSTNVPNAKILVDPYEGDLSEVENPYDFNVSGANVLISFDLYIPFRIQEELLSKIMIERPNKTERFGVLLCYMMYMPIVFIRSEVSKYGFFGSEAVIIVRKYLEAKFDVKKNKQLIFESLGPSPFHANFLIKEMNEEQKKEVGRDITVIENIKRSYDEITYCINTEKQSFEETVPLVFNILFAEIDIYYHIMRVRATLIRKYINSHNVMSTLVDSYISKTSMIGELGKFFSGSSNIRDAIIQITEMEVYELESKFQIKTFSARHDFGENSIVKTRIEEELRDLVSFPATQYRNLIEFLEDRKRHLDNVFIAIISAVLGGAVGGLLALIAG